MKAWSLCSCLGFRGVSHYSPDGCSTRQTHFRQDMADEGCKHKPGFSMQSTRKLLGGSKAACFAKDVE